MSDYSQLDVWPKAETPCLGFCSTNMGDEICIGCGRSMNEVDTWIMMTDEEKEAVWERIMEAKVGYRWEHLRDANIGADEKPAEGKEDVKEQVVRLVKKGRHVPLFFEEEQALELKKGSHQMNGNKSGLDWE